MTKGHRVFITGLGIVSPLGLNVNQNWNKLINGNSCVSKLPETYKFPCKIVSNIDEASFISIESSLNSSEKRTMSRASKLLKFAALEALRDVKKHDLTDEMCGVSIGMGFDGSADGGFTSFPDVSYSKIGPYALTKALGNMPGAHLAIEHGFKGPCISVNTACAAGVNAIGDAFLTIKSGECDLMIAGGVEAAITPWSIGAFSRIRALTTKFNENDDLDAASRPFDKDRSGFVMSEGAGVLLLQSERSLTEEDRNKDYVEVLGFGRSCDASNLVAPDTEGDGGYRCMQKALQEAGISQEQVSYVNPHATSTPLGDLAECKAISKLLIPGDSCLPVHVSSFKGQLGHSLGASGALETVMVAMAMMKGKIPVSGNLKEVDTEIKSVLNDRVSLVTEKMGSIDWPKEGRNKIDRICIKNSLGFGGTNCSIILRYKPREI